MSFKIHQNDLYDRFLWFFNLLPQSMISNSRAYRRASRKLLYRYYIFSWESILSQLCNITSNQLQKPSWSDSPSTNHEIEILPQTLEKMAKEKLLFRLSAQLFIYNESKLDYQWGEYKHKSSNALNWTLNKTKKSGPKTAIPRFWSKPSENLSRCYDGQNQRFDPQRTKLGCDKARLCKGNLVGSRISIKISFRSFCAQFLERCYENVIIGYSDCITTQLISANTPFLHYGIPFTGLDRWKAVIQLSQRSCWVIDGTFAMRWVAWTRLSFNPLCVWTAPLEPDVMPLAKAAFRLWTFLTGNWPLGRSLPARSRWLSAKLIHQRFSQESKRTAF